MFADAVLEATVDCLVELADGGAAMEFAIGTGRVALPLAARGVPVAGIELSADMLDVLRLSPKPAISRPLLLTSDRSRCPLGNRSSDSREEAHNNSPPVQLHSGHEAPEIIGLVSLLYCRLNDSLVDRSAVFCGPASQLAKFRGQDEAIVDRTVSDDRSGYRPKTEFFEVLRGSPG